MQYVLELDEIEVKRITQYAEERGYTSVVEYIRALVAADALVAELSKDWDDADESSDVIEASLREAWHDVATGNVLPIEQLWNKDNE